MGVLRYEGAVQWQSLGPNVKALNMMWAVTGSKWSAMKTHRCILGHLKRLNLTGWKADQIIFTAVQSM